MMFSTICRALPVWTRAALPGAVALALAACAGTPAAPPLPQTDSAGQPILAAGDVVIAGQEAAHAMMDLPEVADAATPPLVRFEGVTNALPTPVDTEPYTDLLRDRLLLITREKLRFVEHTLPPLHSHKGHKASAPPADSGADYEVTARLRPDSSEDTYLIEIQFIDIHMGQPLFTGLYRIRPEAPTQPTYAPADAGGSTIESTAPSAPSYNNPPYPPAAGGSTLQ
jgi:hypothetical protein